MDFLDELVSAENIKSDMKNMEGLINAVTAQYDFCNREMKVNEERAKKLLEKIENDISYQKTVLLRLNEQFHDFVERIQKLIVQLEDAFNSKPIEEALDSEFPQSPEKNSKLSHSDIIKRRETELKSTCDGLNYLYEVVFILYWPDTKLNI
ncbi:hypothetical protein HZS_6764 [Henneguya salminicola]|nr:hypothetical protein HZS_6764 [Henneguya salminicola]